MKESSERTTKFILQNKLR